MLCTSNQLTAALGRDYIRRLAAFSKRLPRNRLPGVATHQHTATAPIAPHRRTAPKSDPAQRTPTSLTRRIENTATQRFSFFRTLLLAALCGALSVNAHWAGAGELPPFLRVSGVSGNLSSVGSDTLASLMTHWTEAFKKAYPDVKVQVQAAGSSTAPPALIQGTSNFGPMSRPMKESETQAFANKHGYAPLGIRVALDALAIYVHKDNPLPSISIEQLDAIYSATRRCGGRTDMRTWGELGLGGSWARRPIKLFGRNSVSGTYGYFKTAALCSGDFKNNVSEQPGSASVVQAVASSLSGIGYSGIGYDTSGVRAIAVSGRDGAPAVPASFANAADRSYPLARYLYIYVHKRPGESLPPLESEFLRLVLSRDGQNIVRKVGHIPLSVAVAERERDKLSRTPAPQRAAPGRVRFHQL